MTRMISTIPKNRRLAHARAQWRFEDRRRGNYTVVRHSGTQITHRRAYKQRQQLQENIMAVAGAALLVLLAGIAGGVTGS